uniref:Uncharacterized protein n=1 Tax=Chromera velia CCMP2878 TaxID=1169474 RepID=A0A0G4FRW2_9ALVE|eukprot:Cvel_18369.t1-p1 / transcript=Cvel_18369.t1 / gene=Cvel_18369 / organism=Chromera_velia_CCMP2878 / gene_product=Ankyrin-3, putative / transcript_product=Ankyrin-3, putative / location=Cvel_scaffold1518:11038-24773(-) / protein_length=665 / sequence_SO=supercontig / SO=protein_coding / is_pseudo=false
MGEKATLLTVAFSAAAMIIWIVAMSIPFWFYKYYFVFGGSVEVSASLTHVTVNSKAALGNVGAKFFDKISGTNSLGQAYQKACAGASSANAILFQEECNGLSALFYCSIVLMMFAAISLMISTAANGFILTFWFGGKSKGRFKKKYREYSAIAYFVACGFLFVADLVYGFACMTFTSSWATSLPGVGSAGMPGMWVSYFISWFGTFVAAVPGVLAQMSKGGKDDDDDDDDDDDEDDEESGPSWGQQWGQMGQQWRNSRWNPWGDHYQRPPPGGNPGYGATDYGGPSKPPSAPPPGMGYGGPPPPGAGYGKRRGLVLTNDALACRSQAPWSPEPLSAQTLCSALDAFTERRKMHNFRLCLTVGAQTDGLVNGLSALLKAVWTRNFAAVRLLADAGAGLEVKCARPVRGIAGRTALHLTCCKRSPEIANFLISRGANVKAEDSKKYTPLHIAAAEGLTDVMVSLLSHGADVNAKITPGDTALHRASYKGPQGAAELLLDRGAHVDERSNSNRTPLHGTLAPRERHLADHSDVAQLLISRGADVNARARGGITVLQHAAAWGSADVAEVVVSAGADMHSTDDSGDTALHHAVRRTRQMNEYAVDHQKKNRIVQILVSNGINTHVCNNSGRTALDLARRYLLQDSQMCTFLGIVPHHSSSSDDNHDEDD